MKEKRMDFMKEVYFKINVFQSDVICTVSTMITSGFATNSILGRVGDALHLDFTFFFLVHNSLQVLFINPNVMSFFIINLVVETLNTE
jgi:hypothetical protein